MLKKNSNIISGTLSDDKIWSYHLPSKLSDEDFPSKLSDEDLQGARDHILSVYTYENHYSLQSKAHWEEMFTAILYTYSHVWGILINLGGLETVKYLQ